jgi:hypothetical protein
MTNVLEEQAQAILDDPHFYHSVGLGLGAMVLAKMAKRGQPAGPPPQVVQIYTKPRNKALLLAVGTAGVAYWYMKVYNHSFFGLNVSEQ